LHEALKLGDRIAIMKEGRFVQIGTPEDIVNRPADDYVAAFTQDVDRSRVITVHAVMRAERGVPRDAADIESLRARLHETDAGGLYLVSEDGRPAALVLRGRLERAGRGARIDDLARTDFPQVRESAHLAALFELCRAGLPIAVTDDDGRYIGVVDPLDVFTEMVGPEVARRAQSTGSSETGPRT
jgi:glycine betaine/proline transport system ATP-binding protein